MTQSLFQMATQGRNVAAAIFWMKARAGWREKQEVDARVASYVVWQDPMTPGKWTARFDAGAGSPANHLSDAALERIVLEARGRELLDADTDEACP